MNFAFNKREQTSYELKVRESLKEEKKEKIFLLTRYFHRVWKLSEKISGCDQLWRVCYVTNVENFENLDLSLFESELNNVLDLFFLTCFVEMLKRFVVNICEFYIG